MKANSFNNLYKVYSRNLYLQPTRCGYGNGTATDYEYNTFGLLTRINTGNKVFQEEPGQPTLPDIPIIGLLSVNDPPAIYGEDNFDIDSTIQNFRYQYDSKGRLVQRSQKNNQYETFQYDNLDRLTSFTQGTLGGITQTFSTTYDLQGNITGNTLAGTYQYDSDKPHAVTSITPFADFPDAIPASQCETEYNLFNQPSRIAEGDVEILLEYGHDGQRVKAVFKRNGQVERTRHYINASYEKEIAADGTVTHYHYVYGAKGLAAVCVRRNGVDSLYYVHPDRLGSYTHITDSLKQVVRALHFDPWGNAKTNTNWTVFDTTTLADSTLYFRFSRGFTGHEHYAELGIINMNGRLYDPVIARFFSPDNYVQSPGFTQSFNRYSYCLNNPLQYVDPSGENAFDAFLYGLCCILTFPARVLTEGVSWVNDHINGDVKPDGYFHSDYLFYNEPPHEIDYQNVVNLQNPYTATLYEPDMMTDADGTTYRTEYYWAAVGAGGEFSYTDDEGKIIVVRAGNHREIIRWYTREVPVEAKGEKNPNDNSNVTNVDVGMITNVIGVLSSIYSEGNSGLSYNIPYGISIFAYGTQMFDIGRNTYSHWPPTFENAYDFMTANIGFWGGPKGAIVGFTLDFLKRGVKWTANYLSEFEMELRRMNSPQTYY